MKCCPLYVILCVTVEDVVSSFKKNYVFSYSTNLHEGVKFNLVFFLSDVDQISLLDQSCSSDIYKSTIYKVWYNTNMDSK